MIREKLDPRPSRISLFVRRRPMVRVHLKRCRAVRALFSRLPAVSAEVVQNYVVKFAAPCARPRRVPRILCGSADFVSSAAVRNLIAVSRSST